MIAEYTFHESDDIKSHIKFHGIQKEAKEYFKKNKDHDDLWPYELLTEILATVKYRTFISESIDSDDEAFVSCEITNWRYVSA